MRFALALVVLLTGCHEALTEIVVHSSSDLAPDAIDQVRLRVDGSAIGFLAQERVVDPRQVGFPLTMSVIHRGGPLGPLTVSATGALGGVDRVSRAAVVTFVSARSITVELPLEASCLDHPACAPQQTCVAGACVDRQTGAPPDADAGVLCADQQCAMSCGCARGCACNLTCGLDVMCRAVSCQGAGTHCAIDAAGASRFQGSCAGGATCVVDAIGAMRVDSLDCTGGSTCELDCTGVSDCRLHCDATSSCLLRCGSIAAGPHCALDMPATSCPGGVWVSGRPCP